MMELFAILVIPFALVVTFGRWWATNDRVDCSSP